MEERNAVLRKNLDTLHWAALSGAVCIVLALIPFVNMIAFLVALVAAAMSFVAMYRLREIHDDFHTAFMLVMINIPLKILEGLLGAGAESVVDLICSVVSFAQVYFIVRAINYLLRLESRNDIADRGEQVVRLYVLNLVVGVAAAAVTLLLGVSSIAAVMLIVSLIVSIVAVVAYIKYLGAAKECF